jgi:hypothetical protein
LCLGVLVGLLAVVVVVISCEEDDSGTFAAACQSSESLGESFAPSFSGGA